MKIQKNVSEWLGVAGAVDLAWGGDEWQRMELNSESLEGFSGTLAFNLHGIRKY